jgi:pimeloyl-ACP methyl ester carboxylesterase
MRASFADVAGVRTRFFHHGEGDQGVLLIHGVGVGADSWLWNVEALGQARMAVAPDLLGYGLTGEGSYREGPPHEAMLDHLAALADHLGLQRLCVVGSSFGANILSREAGAVQRGGRRVHPRRRIAGYTVLAVM